VSRNLAMSVKAPEYFASTVTQADDKFAAAAANAGAKLERITHPRKGPDGETLQVSVARLGAARATKVLLILSGTHGVEGFAGAGVQTGLLHSARSLQIPDDTALLLVHLVNPWGPAWNRREDHENVDCFRNFLYALEPSTPDPIFDEIDDAMDLANLFNRSEAENLARHEKLIGKYGLPRIVAAIRRGQHHRPSAMTYHGQGPCWSRKVLEDVLRRELAGCSHLAVLDLHTGFGKYGEGLVMTYDPPGDARHERVKRWMQGDIYTPGDDFDIPKHAKSPFGFIADWVPGLKVTAAILEFGTFDPEETRDHHLNHYFHMFGDPRSPEGLAVGAKYRRYFYPEEPQWMEAVHARGADVVRRMLDGLKEWQ
jgi:hypothetical protein